MPRKSKGTRLWLRPARPGRDAVWIIRDGERQTTLGNSPHDRAGAEAQLALYIQKEQRGPASALHPSKVTIAEVLSLYTLDQVPSHARPKETLSRISALLDHWGALPCSMINKSSCQRFAKDRPQGTARRQLEDLRAAIKHAVESNLLEMPVPVWLPEKGEPRSRWMTREEAATLIMTAWRATEVQNDVRTKRRVGQHVARFILVGLYTGTRAGAICAASWDQFDLERGLFYRRPAGEVETKKRRTPVPIADRLLPHLKRWKASGTRHPVEWRGKPVLRVTKAFARAASDAKLDEVTPHTLRHTAATWLMQAGVDTWEAAGYLGMTEETLREVYGHHHPDYQRNAARKIGQKSPQLRH